MRTSDALKGDFGQDALDAHAELMAAIGGAAGYEAMAANTTAVLGGTGAIGDILSRVLIRPLTTSPGPVSIKDGSDAAIPIFTGGASSVATLHPIVVPLGLASRTGAWSIITGADVAVLGIGKFT